MTTTRNERGSALIWSMLFVILASGLVIAHTTMLASIRKDRDVRYGRRSLARTFARSGIVDAVSWFRRQEQQPVRSFAPRLDPEADPPVYDTLDPTVGLVREFEIRGNLWGRYEIRKEEALDISAQRGKEVPGSVWEVRVRAFVYRLLDPTRPFDRAPNRLAAATALTTEIRGIPFAPPAPAALSAESPDKIKIRSNVVIDGNGSAAIGHADPMTMPVPVAADAADVDAGAEVDGIPAFVALPNYDSSPERVFGMRLDELHDLADVVIRRDGGNRQWRQDLDDKVIYVPFDLLYRSDVAIRGSLLVVDGDLTKLPTFGAESFEGVIYVTGNATLRGHLELRGALIARGEVDLGGGLGTVIVTYDQRLVTALRRKLSQYRQRRSLNPEDDDQ